MRWVAFGAAVLSACTLVACGGSTTRSCDCSAGFHCVLSNGSPTCVSQSGAGGSAGSAGAPGTGGAGGDAGTPSSTCADAQEKALPTVTAQVGFSQPVGNLPSASVSAVTANSLTLNTSLGTVTFRWAGPSLNTVFQPGDSVTAGQENGWDYVANQRAIAAARADFGTVGDGVLPPMPIIAGPQLTRRVECSVELDCGALMSILEIDATTGAGVVRIGVGQTTKFIGWQIHNENGMRFSPQGCAQAPNESVVTALGPSPINGGP